MPKITYIQENRKQYAFYWEVKEWEYEKQITFNHSQTEFDNFKKMSVEEAREKIKRILKNL